MKVNLLIPMLLLLVFGSASGSVPGHGIEVEIVADDGSRFARYDLASASRGGDLRAYLQAERGRNYGIRVRNHTGGRIGLVIAVDGRNIISGAKSHLRASEPMYVLDAYAEATYQGWRTSDANVQRFYFTDAADSYAEAWGDGSAMGVIVIAAFREVPRVVPQGRTDRQKMAPQPPAPSASRSAESVAPADAATGTGFGESHSSRSVRVHFEPQGHAFSKQFLKYEWRDTLVRLGIIRDAPPPNRFWPEQLGDVHSGSFAPYPPGYWN
jgi:hypothetical protein